MSENRVTGDLFDEWHINTAKDFLEYGFDRFRLAFEGRDLDAIANNVRVFFSDGMTSGGFTVDVSYLVLEHHLQIKIGDNVVISELDRHFINRVRLEGMTNTLQDILADYFINRSVVC